ncbi:hypothetical protein BJP25_00210 [Actinokineospora bangkokensis]|uniref:Uncharacterized protein n=1 Tax=Actinokineospora bangkokensis TaxID=1193682 RepID=A0A1Q9LUA1_9PSEU|nr:hypothetical protein BJP25_00210 [Actinokineospora bangkokensis]
MLGLCCTGLAVAAHGTAGGGVPDTAVTAVMTALVGWAGTAVADRRGGVLATLAVLAVSQAGLHVLLTYIADDHPGQEPSAVLPTPLMLGLHALATLLAAVLLTRAGVAFTAIATAVLRWVGVLVVVLGAGSTAPRPLPVVEWDPDRTVLGVLRRSLGRRGPPLFS